VRASVIAGGATRDEEAAAVAAGVGREHRLRLCDCVDRTLLLLLLLLLLLEARHVGCARARTWGDPAEGRCGGCNRSIRL
tara:strand:+ start:1075 stop:1314 length:240 start_codon:yes stop_codon:yes gene_type:complete